MPYLNVDLDYFSHPKTMRLVGLLGKGSEVLPIRLWCYCGKHHCESGKLSGYSPQEIESIVGWWGQSGQMVEAMLKVEIEPGKGGFLREIESGYEVVDWEEHQGHLRAFKKRARAGAKARWDALNASNASSIAKPDIKQCPKPTKPTKLKKEKPPDFFSPFFLLSNHLKSRILDNNPKAKITDSQVSNWADQARLMIERDSRTEAEIKDMIEWSQADDFWKKTILSMSNLRKHFDRMQMDSKTVKKRSERQNKWEGI
jgi:hypothetical protein